MNAVARFLADPDVVGLLLAVSLATILTLPLWANRP